MTTKEKLIALGFKKTYDPFLYEKEINIKKIRLRIAFCIDSFCGSIMNKENRMMMFIQDFEHLLKVNDYYEKKPSRVTRKYMCGISGSTQKNAPEVQERNHHQRISRT